MKRFFLTLLFVIGTFQVLSAAVYIRLNQLGYSPNREKSVIVLADNNSVGVSWRVLDGNKKFVVSGKIQKKNRRKGTLAPLQYHYALDISAIQTPGTYLFQIGDQKDLLAKKRFRVEKDLHADTATELLMHLKMTRSGTDNTRLHRKSHERDNVAALQRTAKNPKKPNKWIKIEGVTVDLQGGWYDAGDYMKFTLPNALTTYYLLESYKINPALHQRKRLSTSRLVDILDEAKHGLDYLLKVMPNNHDFIIQVGSNIDHEQKDRLPESDRLRTGNRPAFSAKIPQYMALVAAALAKGSQVLASIGEKKMAGIYLKKAEEIWNQAHQKDVLDYLVYEMEWFYPDRTVEDNMALAATELYRASGKKSYLSQAKKYAKAAGVAKYSSWGSLTLTAQHQLSGLDKRAKKNADLSLDHFLKYSRGNLWGKPIQPVWAGLYNYFQVAGAAALRATEGKGKYLDLAYHVQDYMLGRNNWGVSFLATKRAENPVTQVFNQIYRITNVFPTGAIAEGPVDRKSHQENTKWMVDRRIIEKIADTSKWNTKEEVFVDHNRNYATMETTIFGQATALYMISAIDKYEKRR